MSKQTYLILTLIILIITIIIIFINCKKDTFISPVVSNNSIIEYSYKEIDNIDPGPITVTFYILPTSDSSSNINVNKMIKFKIDNNGLGYLSLYDLFCKGDSFNNKISKCIEVANDNINFFTIKNLQLYFSDSRICTPPLDNCICDLPQQLNVITISELTINFGSGISYVNSLSNGISTSQLGDSWGAPIYFEIGANRVKLPTLDNGILTQDISSLYDSSYKKSEPQSITLFKQKYLTQYNNIKFVGEGAGITTVRGSCIFTCYNVNKTSTSLGDGWFSATTYITFPSRRINIEGFLWTGHFGVITDYTLYENTNYKNNLKYSNITVGSLENVSISIPNYKIIDDDNSCIDTTVITQGNVEIICNDLWVELQENTIGGAILPENNLGYPLFLLSNMSIQRIYLNNVTVFSYQYYNSDCKSLMYIYSGFLDKNSTFPADIFIQQCAFASRNTGQQMKNDTNAVSFNIENGDKVSIINSTFHGQTFINSNKLAMFNCYCLHVGNPKIENPNTKYTLVNPALVYSDTNNSNSKIKTGTSNIKTSSRIILQNIIFIVHINGTELNNLFPNQNINTLTNIYNAKLFNINSGYDYFQDRSVYPFILKTNANNSNIQNIFFQNCVYYGIIMNDDNMEKCPFKTINLPYNLNENKCPMNTFKISKTSTFSAINLNNINNVYINTLTNEQLEIGNII